MNIEFEDDYSDVILERGLEYYENGYVSNVKIKNGTVNAIVEGTHDYHVSIKISNGNILSTSCDCPYFYGHDECKHITALLYYLTNEDIKSNTTDEGVNIKSILEKVNEKKLKSFLENLLNTDEDAYNSFRKEFIEYFPKPSKDIYKKRIKQAIRSVGDRHGFINYTKGWEYVEKMYEFTDEAQTLIEKDDYETAFFISKTILDSIPNTEIDGSDGEITTVSNECMNVITDIMNNASIEDKTIREIFEYVLRELKTHNLYIYGVELDELIILFIRNGLFIPECEKALIAAIKSCDEDDYCYSYEKKRYLEFLKELYIITGEHSKEAKLIVDNLDNIDMFKEYIEALSQTTDIQEVISTLISSREKYPKHSKYITNKLLEIYKENNMKIEYKDELYKSFFIYDKFKFEKFLEIKELYSHNDWNIEIENIITKVKTFEYYDDILAKIFIEEKMTDRLFDLVKDKSNINNYSEYLLPKYRNELIEKNIEMIKESLRLASSRKTYHGIAMHLEYIKDLDINKEYICDLLDYIRKNYSNRPALLDEISYVNI